MKTKSVIGKRIVEVVQDRFNNSDFGGVSVAVREIILEDGTCIALGGHECGGEYFAVADAFPPRKGQKRKPLTPKLSKAQRVALRIILDLAETEACGCIETGGNGWRGHSKDCPARMHRRNIETVESLLKVEE